MLFLKLVETKYTLRGCMRPNAAINGNILLIFLIFNRVGVLLLFPHLVF